MRRQPSSASRESSRGRCQVKPQVKPQEPAKGVLWFRDQHDRLLERKLKDSQLRQRIVADVEAALSERNSSPATPSRLPQKYRTLSSYSSDSQLSGPATAMSVSNSVGSLAKPGARLAERAAKRGARADNSMEVVGAQSPPAAKARLRPVPRPSSAPRVQTVDSRRSSNTAENQRARSASRHDSRTPSFGLGSRALPWSPRQSQNAEKSRESSPEAKVSIRGRSPSPTARRPQAKAALLSVVRRSMASHTSSHSIRSSLNANQKVDSTGPGFLANAAQDLQHAASALRRIIRSQQQDGETRSQASSSFDAKENVPVDSAKGRAGSPFHGCRAQHSGVVAHRLPFDCIVGHQEMTRSPSLCESEPLDLTNRALQHGPYSHVDIDRNELDSPPFTLCSDSPELESISSYVPWLDHGRSAALQGENEALRKELERASKQGEELERLQRLAEERTLALEKEKARLLKLFHEPNSLASPVPVNVGIGILSLEEQNRALRAELSEATKGQPEESSSPVAGLAERQKLEEQLRGAEERCHALAMENARLQRLERPMATCKESLSHPNSLQELLVMSERAGRQMDEVLQRNANVPPPCNGIIN